MPSIKLSTFPQFPKSQIYDILKAVDVSSRYDPSTISEITTFPNTSSRLPLHRHNQQLVESATLVEPEPPKNLKQPHLVEPATGQASRR